MMLTSLILALSLLSPSPDEAATFADLLSDRRWHQELGPVDCCPEGVIVARQALSRFAVTGERAPLRDGWAVVYSTAGDGPREALSLWAAAYRPGLGLFAAEAAQVGYARTGSTHAAAYRQAPPRELPPESTAGVPMEPVATRAAAGDPYGFCVWLNGVRAGAGLGAVAWDQNLADWAIRNSMVGFGHAVRMGQVQNSGVGELWTVCNMWLASPAHAAALFNPVITRVGIGVVGSTWTFNGD